MFGYSMLAVQNPETKEDVHTARERIYDTRLLPVVPLLDETYSQI